MEKKTVQDYIDIINQKKWDAHNIQWLYIDINAKELMTEVEPKVNNLTACCKAMIEIMLEGDRFMELPKVFRSQSVMKRAALSPRSFLSRK